MGKLANEQHEAFALATAQGHDRGEAYRLAGYSENQGRKAMQGAGSRLYRRPDVQGRVEEIEGELHRNGIEESGTTRAWVLDKLRTNYETAVEGDTKPDLTAANRSLELIGKEHNMFKDRMVLESLDSELEAMSRDQLRNFVYMAAAEVGVRIVQMNDDDKRDWIVRNAASVGLRVTEDGQGSDGSEVSEAVELPSVSETAGVPRSRLN